MLRYVNFISRAISAAVILFGLCLCDRVEGGTGERSSCEYGELTQLLASDGSADDEFGEAVAVWGKTAIIGARNAGVSDEGEAYVYVYGAQSNWVQEGILTPPGASWQFGTSVDVCGDTAIVGADMDDLLNDDAGAAYVFVRDTQGQWTQQGGH